MEVNVALTMGNVVVQPDSAVKTVRHRFVVLCPTATSVTLDPRASCVIVKMDGEG